MIGALDETWFAANPNRDYRVRRLTPAEIAVWPVQPPAEHIAWGVVRRTPPAIAVFSQHWTDTFKLDDDDFELEMLFGDLCRHTDDIVQDLGGAA